MFKTSPNRYTANQKNLLYFIFFASALTQISITIYLPVFLDLTQVFHCSRHAVQLSLAFFLLGFGLSQIFYGVLSEYIGRKRTLLMGFALFFIATVSLCFSTTISYFIFFRMIQGLGAGAGMGLARAMLRDAIPDTLVPHAASYPSMGFAFGFGIGPVMGGFLNKGPHGWLICTAFIALLVLIGFCWKLFFLKETLEKKSEIPLRSMAQIHFNILTHPLFLASLFVGVFSYSVVLAYNVLSPFLIQQNFHLSPQIYGHIALGIAFFYYTAVLFNKKFVLTFGIFPIIYTGLALIFASGILIALFYFLQITSVPLYIAIIFLAVFGQGLVWPNSVAWSMHFFKDNPGVASGVFAALQMLLASLLGSIFSFLPTHSILTFSAVFIVLTLLASSVLYFCRDILIVNDSTQQSAP